MDYLNKNTHYNLKFLGGFTVIETLVAITILLLSIVGPMEIASKGLFTAMYARDEITAFYLGQEAIEYIRNARDTSYLVNNYIAPPTEERKNWLYGLSECNTDESSDGCIINATLPFMDDEEPTENALIECDGACPVMNFDYDLESDSGIYNYNSGQPASKYTRTIKLIPKDNRGVAGEEALIEVTVKWNSGSFFAGQRTFVIRERLLNWRSKNQ